MSNSYEKVIKTIPNELKGNLLFENDFVIIYFHREDVIKLLTREKFSKSISSCNKARIDNYINDLHYNYEQIGLFKELSNPDNPEEYFVIELQRHLVELLILNSQTVLYNKRTNTYEKEFVFVKRADNWACCFAEFILQNKEVFLTTRYATDVVIIEECDY